MGKMVASFPTRESTPLNVMCQNPSNAIIHLGHRGGTVTLWSPNVKESLMKILCHTTPVLSVAVDAGGNYMATSAVDRKIHLWDLRQQTERVATINVPCGASSLNFSQRGLLSATCGHTVQVFDTNKILDSSNEQKNGYYKPYLRHNVNGQIANARFCPYEDVLAIGYDTGVSSILVPGSGEPNFDALEVNPFMSKKQRREAEVRLLLDKIQPELIDLDPSKINEVHRPSAVEKEEQRRKLLLGKPDQMLIEPRAKVRGLPIEKRKRIIKAEQVLRRKREMIQQKEMLDEVINEGATPKKEKQEVDESKTGIDKVLSRFNKQKKY